MTTATSQAALIACRVRILQNARSWSKAIAFSAPISRSFFSRTPAAAAASSILFNNNNNCNCNYNTALPLRHTPFHSHSLQTTATAATTRRWLGSRNRNTPKERKPTKKQRKQYHRKLQKLQQEKERHGMPGSKAGPRREFVQNMQKQLLEEDEEKDNDDMLQLGGDDDDDDNEYNVEDALLDDLMGNTKELSSQPTPEPVYLGHKHVQYYNRVADQMDIYHEHLEKLKQLQQQQQQQQSSKDDFDDVNINNKALIDNAVAALPSDRDISLVLRAYRDLHGTRQKPVGLVKALQHLVQDLKIPLTTKTSGPIIMGELSFTALLTTCRTPAEARRVFQMMRDQQHPISAYSWSILVDVYAKVGDFAGCAAAMDEMVTVGQHSPTLPAYTSLLAACYKVCNNGRVAHSIRATAGDLAWQKWQEMRVVGVDPDVMAYGAMLRICAARGHAERSLNVLEEMQMMEVKPTTLCFTSALRAVARSHAIAVRYEKGSSRRHQRREFLTSHHGKMARQLLIMAENAEVDQDDGFVAALIMCAAEAGDVATAKAIYVASQVRLMDHLRTIGSDEHLARLRGESTISAVEERNLEYINSNPSMTLTDGIDGSDASYQEFDDQNQNSSVVMSSGDSNVAIHSKKKEDKYPSFGEREYGKDTRVLSAILHACAVAADKAGMGTIWQGRENKGFLCANSLRLIQTPWKPRYADNSIPGQGRTDLMTWEGEHYDLDERRDRLKPPKFKGIEYTEGGSTLDELDETFQRIYLDDEGRLKEEFQKTTPEDIWRMKYPNAQGVNEHVPIALPEAQQLQLETSGKQDAHPSNTDEPSEMFFDYDDMRWKTRPVTSQVKADVIVTSIGRTGHQKPSSDRYESDEIYFDTDTMTWRTGSDGAQIEADTIVQSGSKTQSQIPSETETNAEEMYFDYETMKWKTRRRDAIEEPTKATVTVNEDRNESFSVEESQTEMYFDTNEMRWKTRTIEEANAAKRTSFKNHVLQEKNSKANEIPQTPQDDDEEAFAVFFEDLQAELKDNGEDAVTEEEARELFLLMKDEFNEAMSMDLKELIDGDSSALEMEQEQESIEGEEANADDITFEKLGQMTGQRQTYDTGSVSSQQEAPSTTSRAVASSVQQPSTANVAVQQQSVGAVELDESFWSRVTDELGMDLGENELQTTFNELAESAGDDHNDVELHEYDLYIEELQKVLPTFSEKRLHRIKRVFQTSLSDPSLLDLIPLVRERMPDYVTSTWLKQMSSLTARYVLYKAAQENKVDIHMLNGILELEAASGSLDRALELYETGFSDHGISPTAYSDRLMVQMFLKNNRISRALTFKQKLNEKKRNLDIPSYGSLIDYCARHGHAGSSLLLLKECISIHKSPPGEAYLSQLRILCRRAGITEEIGLPDMIGEDPIKWLKHGEAHLKREYSKKGRRDVILARNRLLQM